MTCSPHTNFWPNWTNLNIWGQSQITKRHQLPCTASRLELRFATNYFLTLLTNCQPIWLFWISEVSLKWQSDLQWPQVPRTALRLELKYYTTNYFLVLHTKFQPNRTTLNIQEINHCEFKFFRLWEVVNTKYSFGSVKVAVLQFRSVTPLRSTVQRRP